MKPITTTGRVESIFTKFSRCMTSMGQLFEYHLQTSMSTTRYTQLMKRYRFLTIHLSFQQDFYDILYPSTTSGRRANKSASLTKFFGLDDSLFSTIEHDTHRMRRAALLPFFSPSYVRKLQPMFQERIDVLLARIANLKDTEQAVNANCLFAAFSNGE